MGDLQVIDEEGEHYMAGKFFLGNSETVEHSGYLPNKLPV